MCLPSELRSERIPGRIGRTSNRRKGHRRRERKKKLDVCPFACRLNGKSELLSSFEGSKKKKEVN